MGKELLNTLTTANTVEDIRYVENVDDEGYDDLRLRRRHVLPRVPAQRLRRKAQRGMADLHDRGQAAQHVHGHVDKHRIHFGSRVPGDHRDVCGTEL